MSYQVFDCLSAGTSIEGQKLLEASAGTGKTFAIEHIVTRLVLSGVSIDEILIVTFTNLATDELKERILANFNSTYIQLKERKEEGVFPYLKKYFQENERFDKAIINLQNAISFFDDAQIFTIHSFCKRALQEYSFEAELTFLFSDLELKTKERVLKNRLKKILLNPQLSKVFFASSFHHFLKSKNLDVLIDKILSYANRGDFDQIKQVSISEIVEEIKENFESKGFTKLNYEKILQDFYLNSKNYKKTNFSKENFEEQIKIIAKLTFDFSDFKSWDQLLFHGASIGKFFSKGNLKVKTFKVEKENYPAFFSFFSETVYPQLMTFFDPKYFLNGIIFNLKNELIFQIEKVSCLSADMLLEIMEKSLNNDSFKKAIKCKYKAAIVDEFQDTDHLQWSIFLKAFLSEPKIKFFYLVGDPKQSIYAFRNADVYTYLKAANFLKKENIYLLDTNYRSTEALVEGLNSLFNRKWLYLPKLKSVLEYHPVKANNKSNSLNPIHYLVADKEQCADVEFDMLFPFFLDNIQSRKRPLSDYAILVKDRFQEQKIQSFLSSHNIACVARKKAIHETHAYDCLKQIMRSIFDPNDISNIKLIMLLLNYTLKDLEDEIKVNYFLISFNQLHTLYKSKGVESCISQLIDLSFHGYSLVERLTQKDQLASVDFTDAVDLLLDFALKKHLSENSFENFYQELEKSLKQRQAKASDDAVQILTVHKSKGLEFEIVFCLGIAFTSSDHILQTQSKEEIEAEKLRQLYVAFTRAKSELYIPVIISQKTKKSASPIDLFIQNVLGNNNKLDFFSLSELLQTIHSSDHYKITLLQKQKKAVINEKTNSLENFLERFPDRKSDGQFLSFTSVSKSYGFEKSDQECDSFPPGPVSGVIIHKILEDIFSKKNKKIDVKKYLKNTILENFEESIGEMINKLLKVKFSPYLFSLDEIDLSRAITELEFCYKVNQNKMKGFIDLIFNYQNKYFIVDWKTNFLGNEPSCYDKDNLHKVMVQHDYFLQGSIYANSLQKALKLFNKKSFEEIFGGIFFVFLRGINAKGNGLFYYFPSDEK